MKDFKKFNLNKSVKTETTDHTKAMKEEEKKIERPELNHYNESPSLDLYRKHINDLHVYCTQLEAELNVSEKAKHGYESQIKIVEQERNEYKLKEEIAYTAKEIAQEAHQKVVKERDGLKKENKRLKSIIDEHLEQNSITGIYQVKIFKH